MADNGNTVTFPWVNKLLISVCGGVILLFVGGAAWWATSVWSMASTATEEIIEIHGQLKELNDNYSASHDWMKQIATSELDDHDKIVGLQADRDRMQHQLDAVGGIRDPKGQLP